MSVPKVLHILRSSSDLVPCSQTKIAFLMLSLLLSIQLCAGQVESNLAPGDGLSSIRCALNQINPNNLLITTWSLAGTAQAGDGEQRPFLLEGNGKGGQRFAVKGYRPSTALMLPGRAQVETTEKPLREIHPLSYLSQLDYFPVAWLSLAVSDPKTTVIQLPLDPKEPESTLFRVTPWVDPRFLVGPPLRGLGKNVARTDLAGRTIYFDSSCHIVRMDAYILSASGQTVLLRTNRFSNFSTDAQLSIAHHVDETINNVNARHIELNALTLDPELSLQPK